MPMGKAAEDIKAAAPDAHPAIDDDLVSVQSRCTEHIMSVKKGAINELKSLNSPNENI